MTAINFNNIPDLSLKNNLVFETNRILNYSNMGNYIFFTFILSHNNKSPFSLQSVCGQFINFF